MSFICVVDLFDIFIFKFEWEPFFPNWCVFKLHLQELLHSRCINMGSFTFTKRKLELYDKVTMAVFIIQFHQISEKEKLRERNKTSTHTERHK